MTARLMVFLDDGGVMNDNSTRALQWQRLVSEFFVPLLGGSADAWTRANRVVADLGIAPADALVVDDSPRAIEWATRVGARAVLVGDSSLPQTGTTVHIQSLVELPAMLQRLD